MTDEEQPVRFTVAVPVWNGAHFVGRVLESVRAQTYPHWELVIGDNASDDDLGRIVSTHDDPRIRYQRWETHVGPNQNFNRTMALAATEWVIPIGADDRLRADALDTIASALRRGRQAPGRIALVVAACTRVTLSGASAEAEYYGSHRPISPVPGRYNAAAWLRLAATGGPFPWNIGSIAFSRSALVESGAFRPDIGLAADMELIFRLATVGDVLYLDERLMEFAVHDASDGNVQWAANRRDPKSEVPIANAILRALAAHDAAYGVNAADSRSVRRAAALAYLHRAAQHRVLAGGLGRRGAARDLARALRLTPWILASRRAIPMALGSLTAPTWLLRTVSTTMQRKRRAA